MSQMIAGTLGYLIGIDRASISQALRDLRDFETQAGRITKPQAGAGASEGIDAATAATKRYTKEEKEAVRATNELLKSLRLTKAEFAAGSRDTEESVANLQQYTNTLRTAKTDLSRYANTFTDELSPGALRAREAIAKIEKELLGLYTTQIRAARSSEELAEQFRQMGAAKTLETINAYAKDFSRLRDEQTNGKRTLAEYRKELEGLGGTLRTVQAAFERGTAGYDATEKALANVTKELNKVEKAELKAQSATASLNATFNGRSAEQFARDLATLELRLRNLTSERGLDKITNVQYNDGLKEITADAQKLGAGLSDVTKEGAGVQRLLLNIGKAESRDAFKQQAAELDGLKTRFAELRFAAEQPGASVKELAERFRELSKQVDDFSQSIQRSNPLYRQTQNLAAQAARSTTFYGTSLQRTNGVIRLQHALLGDSIGLLYRMGPAGAVAAAGINSVAAAAIAGDAAITPLIAKLAPFIALAAGIVAIGGTIFAASKQAIQLETALAGVAKTTGLSNPELVQLTRNMQAISIETGASTKELLEMAAVAGQMGTRGVNNLSRFVNTLNKLALTTDVVGAEGAKQLAEFLAATGVAIEDYGAAAEEVSLVLNALENNLATSAGAILESTQYTKQLASTFNVSRTDILVFTGAMESLGLAAEGSGSALATTFFEIGKFVREGAPELETFATLTKRTVADFSRLFKEDSATAVREIILGFAQAKEAGFDLAEVLDLLSLSEQRQGRTVAGLTGGYDNLYRVLGLVNDREALELIQQTEIERQLETTSGQWKLLTARFAVAAQVLGESFLPTIKAATTGMVENSDAIAIGVGSITVLIGALGSAGLAIGGFATAVTGQFIIAGEIIFAFLQSIGTAFQALQKVSEANSQLWLNPLNALKLYREGLAAVYSDQSSFAERLKAINSFDSFGGLTYLEGVKDMETAFSSDSPVVKAINGFNDVVEAARGNLGNFGTDTEEVVKRALAAGLDVTALLESLDKLDTQASKTKGLRTARDAFDDMNKALKIAPDLAIALGDQFNETYFILGALTNGVTELITEFGYDPTDSTLVDYITRIKEISTVATDALGELARKAKEFKTDALIFTTQGTAEEGGDISAQLDELRARREELKDELAKVLETGREQLASGQNEAFLETKKNAESLEKQINDLNTQLSKLVDTRVNVTDIWINRLVDEVANKIKSAEDVLPIFSQRLRELQDELVIKQSSGDQFGAEILRQQIALLKQGIDDVSGALSKAVTERQKFAFTGKLDGEFWKGYADALEEVTQQQLDLGESSASLTGFVAEQAERLKVLRDEQAAGTSEWIKFDDALKTVEGTLNSLLQGGLTDILGQFETGDIGGAEALASLEAYKQSLIGLKDIFGENTRQGIALNRTIKEIDTQSRSISDLMGNFDELRNARARVSEALRDGEKPLERDIELLKSLGIFTDGLTQTFPEVEKALRAFEDGLKDAELTYQSNGDRVELLTAKQKLYADLIKALREQEIDPTNTSLGNLLTAFAGLGVQISQQTNPIRGLGDAFKYTQEQLAILFATVTPENLSGLTSALAVLGGQRARGGDAADPGEHAATTFLDKFDAGRALGQPFDREEVMRSLAEYQKQLEIEAETIGATSKEGKAYLAILDRVRATYEELDSMGTDVNAVLQAQARVLEALRTGSEPLAADVETLKDFGINLIDLGAKFPAIESALNSYSDSLEKAQIEFDRTGDRASFLEAKLEATTSLMDALRKEGVDPAERSMREWQAQVDSLRESLSKLDPNVKSLSDQISDLEAQIAAAVASGQGLAELEPLLALLASLQDRLANATALDSYNVALNNAEVAFKATGDEAALLSDKIKANDAYILELSKNYEANRVVIEKLRAETREYRLELEKLKDIKILDPYGDAFNSEAVKTIAEAQKFVNEQMGISNNIFDEAQQKLDNWYDSLTDGERAIGTNAAEYKRLSKAIGDFRSVDALRQGMQALEGDAQAAGLGIVSIYEGIKLLQNSDGDLAVIVAGLSAIVDGVSQTIDSFVRMTEALRNNEATVHDVVKAYFDLSSVVAEIVGQLAGIPGLGAVVQGIGGIFATVAQTFSDWFTGDSGWQRALRKSLKESIVSAFVSGIVEAAKGSETALLEMGENIKSIFFEKIVDAFVNTALVIPIIEPIIAEFARILEKQGTDAAFAYLDAVLPAALDKAAGIAEDFVNRYRDIFKPVTKAEQGTATTDNPYVFTFDTPQDFSIPGVTDENSVLKTQQASADVLQQSANSFNQSTAFFENTLKLFGTNVAEFKQAVTNFNKGYTVKDAVTSPTQVFDVRKVRLT